VTSLTPLPYLQYTILETNANNFTDIDKALEVADEKIAQDSGFVEIAQMNHIFDAIPRRGVHRPQLGISSDPAFLSTDNHNDLDTMNLGH